MYETYQYDNYFRSYVDGYFQSSNLPIVALATVTIFSGIGGGLYARLRHTRLQLHHALSSEEEAAKNSVTGGVLAPHEEQHLLDMIRKTTPTPTNTSGTLPVLKREDQARTTS